MTERINITKASGDNLIKVCAESVYGMCSESAMLEMISLEYAHSQLEGIDEPAEIFGYAFARGMTFMLHEIVTGHLDVNLISRRKSDGKEEGSDNP